MKKPSYSIIIPVYNEKQNIKQSAEKILEAFVDYSNTIEILFVDDNSPDGTAKEIEEVSKKLRQVKLIQHGKKEGIGAAHRAGYISAQGKYILCIDADLSQSPLDLLEIKNKLDEGYDLAIGSRYLDEGKQIGKSFIRDVGSRGMNWICRLVLGINLTDCTHTFRGFRRSLFDELKSKIDAKGHPSFQVQFSFWIVRSEKKVVEVPIDFTEREEDRGESKLSIKKEAPDFLKVVFKLFLNRIFNQG